MARVISTRFSIASPVNSHTRITTCEEVECSYNREGWKVRVETLLPESMKAIKTSGRSYKKVQIAPGETYLYFPAGQQCFNTHRVSLDRPEFFYVKDRNGLRRHNKAENWVEEHSESLDRLRRKIQ